MRIPEQELPVRMWGMRRSYAEVLVDVLHRDLLEHMNFNIADKLAPNHRALRERWVRIVMGIE